MALKDKYLTITEAAKRLGVTRQTISRWIAKKYVAAEKVGRQTLIHKSDLYRYKRWRISEDLANKVRELYLSIAEDYLREKGILKESQRLQFVDPEEPPKGTVRFLKSKEEAEIDSRVKPIMIEVLKELHKKAIEERKEEPNQKE